MDYLSRRGRLLTSSRPMPDWEVVASSGAWLHLADGRRIFDGSSGLLCANVGQGSPKVFSRLAKQFSKYTYGGAAVVQPHVQMELMHRLCHAVGRPEDSVALTTCGTLGVEVAVGLARNITRVRDGKRRGDILTSTLSYHGMSALTLGLAGNHARRPRPEDALGLGPAFVPPYLPTHPLSARACDASCADEIAHAIDSIGAQNVSAVLMEPVNGSTGGAYVPPADYLRRLSEICQERDALVIHDEVLTGLWRTGTPLASDHWEGAEPDLCILSKGLGGGYTGVGAVLVTPEIAPLIRHEHADPLPAMGTMATHPGSGLPRCPGRAGSCRREHAASAWRAPRKAPAGPDRSTGRARRPRPRPPVRRGTGRRSALAADGGGREPRRVLLPLHRSGKAEERRPRHRTSADRDGHGHRLHGHGARRRGDRAGRE